MLKDRVRIHFTFALCLNSEHFTRTLDSVRFERSRTADGASGLVFLAPIKDDGVARLPNGRHDVLPNDLERARRDDLLNALGRRDVHADHHNCGQSKNVRVLMRDRSEQCMYGYSTAQASCAAYHWPQERSWPPAPAMKSDPVR